ncbi:unnamed protein product [Arctogadus glacialis]
MLLLFDQIKSSRYRLTRIAVDNEAGPYSNQTVVFLGSERGIILKFLAKMDSGFLNDSLFLEELNVYNPESQATKPPASSELTQGCLGQPARQMASLSFRRVLSGYALPNHSY